MSDVGVVMTWLLSGPSALLVEEMGGGLLVRHSDSGEIVPLTHDWLEDIAAKGWLVSGPTFVHKGRLLRTWRLTDGAREEARPMATDV